MGQLDGQVQLYSTAHELQPQTAIVVVEDTEVDWRVVEETEVEETEVEETEVEETEVEL